jgi:hypothetical protein
VEASGPDEASQLTVELVDPFLIGSGEDPQRLGDRECRVEDAGRGDVDEPGAR